MLLDTVMLCSGDQQNTITVHVTLSPHCSSFDLTIERALDHRPPQVTRPDKGQSPVSPEFGTVQSLK